MGQKAERLLVVVCAHPKTFDQTLGAIQQFAMNRGVLFHSGKIRRGDDRLFLGKMPGELANQAIEEFRQIFL